MQVLGPRVNGIGAAKSLQGLCGGRLAEVVKDLAKPF